VAATVTFLGNLRKEFPLSRLGCRFEGGCEDRQICRTHQVVADARDHDLWKCGEIRGGPGGQNGGVGNVMPL